MRTLLCLLAIIAAPALSARAQQRISQPAPVDQAVADVDPLAQSLRRVEPGNARFAPNGRIYRLQDSARSVWRQLDVPTLDVMRSVGRRERTYRYEAPGVQAYLRRPEYTRRSRNGQQRAVVPADTVFDLVPKSAQPRRPARPQSRQSPDTDGWVDRRIDTRLNTRINGRTDTFSRARPQRPTAPQRPRRPAQPARPAREP